VLDRTLRFKVVLLCAGLLIACTTADRSSADCPSGTPTPALTGSGSDNADAPAPTEAVARGRRGACPREIPGVRNFAEVSKDKLYRSAQPTPEGFKTLKEQFGIKTIVSLRAIHSDRSETEAVGLRYYRISFKPWHPEPEDVVQFLKIVTDAQNQPVLVHCQHGADRTGTMVAIYRMYLQGWFTEDAIGEMSRFGFHTIWSNLQEFLRGDDWRKAVIQAGIPKNISP
jgi:protein tyrosine phosphatase (PTP) superfamily phosphohydrolase (DUF442 family)